MADGRLARNPADGITAPKLERRQVQVLTAAEVARLADAIDPRYRTLVNFLAFTGLRPSEALALKVGQVNLLHHTVRVVEAMVELDGHLVTGPTKTYAQRTVVMPRFLAAELGHELAGRAPTDHVFTAPRGGPIRMSKFGKTIWRPAVRAAGLPATVTPYTLRHTCASLLLAQGASVVEVAAQLGHASPTITLSVYAHLLPGRLDALADRLDELHELQPQRQPDSQSRRSDRVTGGGGGVRTHGTLSGPATFKVAAFDRSATPPHSAYLGGPRPHEPAPGHAWRPACPAIACAA